MCIIILSCWLRPFAKLSTPYLAKRSAYYIAPWRDIGSDELQILKKDGVIPFYLVQQF